MKHIFAVAAATLTLLCKVDATEPSGEVTLKIENLTASFVSDILLQSDPGELVIESSTTLEPDSWTEYGRLASIDVEIEYPDTLLFNLDSDQRFFRTSLFSSADGFYINGDISTHIHENIDFALLNTAFNLGFDSSEAILIEVDEIEQSLAAKAAESPRNARVYAGAIATLVRTAQTIRSRSPLDFQPTTEELTATLVADLQDGTLNDPDLNDPIESWELVQSIMEGLENVEIHREPNGTLSFSVPAIWDEFNWDSADWQ